MLTNDMYVPSMYIYQCLPSAIVSMEKAAASTGPGGEVSQRNPPIVPTPWAYLALDKTLAVMQPNFALGHLVGSADKLWRGIPGSFQVFSQLVLPRTKQVTPHSQVGEITKSFLRRALTNPQIIFQS